MHKVRNVMLAVAVTGLIMACGLGSAPSGVNSNVATIVAATIQALTPPAPAATQALQATAPEGIPVNYRNVRFVIPIGLATDAVPELVPVATEDNGGPWDAAPEHIRFRLDNYSAPANSFSVNRIDVYPADAYASANAGANISLQRLKGVLGNPSASLTNTTLPQVPYFNAASMFVAQIHRIHFMDGDGVRTITQYGQAVGPVTNGGIFYHFQGLTSDGKYYVVAVLPVQLPYLQNGSEPNAQAPAGGIPFPGNNFNNASQYEQYFKAISDKLDGTDSSVFQPPLSQLDTLMQSFQVTP
ncbi:MAG TPA: hypothetical protein VF784_17240 [Anaerolineales bacterium]